MLRDFKQALRGIPAGIRPPRPIDWSTEGSEEHLVCLVVGNASISDEHTENLDRIVTVTGTKTDKLVSSVTVD